MKRFAWLGFLILAVCMPAFAVPVHGPGLHENPIVLDDGSGQVGTVGIYNSTNLLIDEKGVMVFDVSFDDDWKIECRRRK